MQMIKETPPRSSVCCAIRRRNALTQWQDALQLHGRSDSYHPVGLIDQLYQSLRACALQAAPEKASTTGVWYVFIDVYQWIKLQAGPRYFVRSFNCAFFNNLPRFEDVENR